MFDIHHKAPSEHNTKHIEEKVDKINGFLVIELCLGGGDVEARMNDEWAHKSQVDKKFEER